MDGYIGETAVDISNSKYAGYSKSDWAMLWLERYGGIDGAHHKDWVLDHIVRILKGTKVDIRIAKWKNGHEEERFSLKEPTKEYWDWVADMKDGEDGPNTYGYDFGVAP